MTYTDLNINQRINLKSSINPTEYRYAIAKYYALFNNKRYPWEPFLKRINQPVL